MKAANNMTRKIQNMFIKRKKGNFLALFGVIIIFIQSTILTNMQKEIFEKRITQVKRVNPRIFYTDKFETKKNRGVYENRRRTRTVLKDDFNNDSNIDYENIEYETLSSGKVDSVCVPSQKWQKIFYPTCNSMHELNIPENIYPLGRGK